MMMMMKAELDQQIFFIFVQNTVISELVAVVYTVQLYLFPGVYIFLKNYSHSNMKIITPPPQVR